MGRTLGVIIPLLAVCVCARADLKEILSESITGPKQGMRDVQDYCETRVPPMPKVETKEEREVIEKDWTMDKTPEMFCFGSGSVRILWCRLQPAFIELGRLKPAPQRFETKLTHYLCFGLLAEFDLKEIEGMVAAGKLKKN